VSPAPLLAFASPGRREASGRKFAHLSDEAVIGLVAGGDEQALGELYDRFGAVAYGLAFRVLRDESLSEDAVQEAFLGIWRSAASFLPERARPSTWILTLVHRRAVDLVRREERRRAEPLQPVHHPATETATDEEVSLRARRQLVRAALQRLPAEQREALELAYYGGFSQSQLAERLGEPLGTIKSRTFAGLARLRDLLREAGMEESVSLE
jgi:RNA polymerase sigma factor (sigma-70 family)